MIEVLHIGVLALYVGSLFAIFLYSLIQLHLVFKYRRARRKEQDNAPKFSSAFVPFVTIQLPVFNERYVVERLIDCVAAMDYPTDKFEIQVLDDSTDESFDIAAAKVKEVAARGIDIKHIKRPERVGFKAGALQYGLDIAKGEHIAIFDADFLPKPDFLKQTIPYFQDNEIGMVQTRWGHINEDYSILTRVQAFHLNAHFSLEQRGRNGSGYFMNFNGTAGVWRKQAIIDGGGWQHDTLTEDLDLSYRTQFAGWKFKYLEDVVSPAELPAVVSAVKSQQYRWMKGNAEVCRKLVKQVWQRKEPFWRKLHGVGHLLSGGVFIPVLLSALTSIPLLFIMQVNPEISAFLSIGPVFFIAFIVLTLFYMHSLSIRDGGFWKKTWYFIRMYPAFLSLSLGLALHNSIAVIRGYLGKRSDFIRTPKFDIIGISGSWKNNKYLNRRLDWITILEGLLTAYFAIGLVFAFVFQSFGFFVFHLILVLGYGFIFFYSLYHARLSRS